LGCGAKLSMLYKGCEQTNKLHTQGCLSKSCHTVERR